MFSSAPSSRAVTPLAPLSPPPESLSSLTLSLQSTPDLRVEKERIRTALLGPRPSTSTLKQRSRQPRSLDAILQSPGYGSYEAATWAAPLAQQLFPPTSAAAGAPPKEEWARIVQDSVLGQPLSDADLEPFRRFSDVPHTFQRPGQGIDTSEFGSSGRADGQEMGVRDWTSELAHPCFTRLDLFRRTVAEFAKAHPTFYNVVTLTMREYDTVLAHLRAQLAKRVDAGGLREALFRVTSELRDVTQDHQGCAERRTNLEGEVSDLRRENDGLRRKAEKSEERLAELERLLHATTRQMFPDRFFTFPKAGTFSNEETKVIDENENGPDSTGGLGFEHAVPIILHEVEGLRGTAQRLQEECQSLQKELSAAYMRAGVIEQEKAALEARLAAAERRTVLQQRCIDEMAARSDDVEQAGLRAGLTEATAKEQRQLTWHWQMQARGLLSLLSYYLDRKGFRDDPPLFPHGEYCPPPAPGAKPRRAAPPISAAATQVEPTFKALGNGPDVPVFLRGTGKVKNRNMGKPELDGLMAEIWKDKLQYEEKYKKKVEFGPHFQKMLKMRFGVDSVCLEWAYSLWDGCKRYGYDDVEYWVFGRMMLGDLPEDTYQDLTKTTEDLKKAFKKKERQLLEEPQLRSGKHRPGMIPVPAVYQVLDDMFSAKSQVRLRCLRFAVQLVCGDDDVALADGVQWVSSHDLLQSGSRFLEEVKRQLVQEYDELVQDIRVQVLQLTQTRTEDELASLDIFQNAFLVVDPRMPKATVRHVVAVAAELPLPALPPQSSAGSGGQSKSSGGSGAAAVAQLAAAELLFDGSRQIRVGQFFRTLKRLCYFRRVSPAVPPDPPQLMAI
eukprot:TRINITY_DN21021_c0_g1_i1.p1 TRINITY_DN21021_c0_g1~~TRINITY_DN21021_c0_g1_i1.p1  ORF type:complete len:840 (+),score=157.16 TRINITY_DN21021_c0_g1_i1:112-2631(+)